MTLLKYGDRVLSFRLMLYLNVVPSCSPLMCVVRLKKALFCKLSSPSDDSQMSQQNKWVIFWFSLSCKLKIVDVSSTPLWNSLHLLFGGFQFYTWGPRVCSDVVEAGERRREGGCRVCDAHVCDLTAMGVKQH